MAYWHRTAAHTFTPTEHVGGAWDLRTQHIAPALGVLAHEVERDRDRRRGADLVISRLSYDILGTVPLAAIDVEVEVLRPGRTIELVQATARSEGRAVVVLRAWLTEPYDTAALAGTAVEPIPGPEQTPPWDMAGLWRGGFIASIEARRTEHAPGRASAWFRTPHALVADEEVSRFAATAGMIDVSNGTAVRADPAKVAFPNLDVTAHFHRHPVGEWVGLDVTVTFGATGMGLTSAVLHDEQGPVGIVAQTLTVRPPA
ncbi:thioesterase family protein [Nocardioides sp. zg-536]|uniref:Thioesterase family protein n=1 Tax=Nocardioides faecalis TaxID=2803858 RepID=A0A938Y267_9ACTN|nr:thioesterase family protein [Nocardioides faecalis]MBS4752756.1 thioesterase family protein [Nocardioides faecalis]QVI60678.1 thioesterase family protein [Nocardioides faecalis]